MARLTNCVYCGSSLLNAEWHPECRAEFMEDLLAQIKSAIEKDNELLLRAPNTILTIVKRENFRTTEEIRKARVKAAEIEGEREKRELAKKVHMSECARKWDKEHPDEDEKGIE